MITFQIQGATATEVRSQLQDLLANFSFIESKIPAAPARADSAPAQAVALPTPAAAGPVTPSPDAGATSAGAAAPAAPVEGGLSKPRRGRPPRAATQLPPSGAGREGNPEPQAQVGNSASVAAGTTPPAEATPSSEANTEGAVSFEAMKAKLQQVASTPLPGDGTDEAAGMNRASAILAPLGYQRVREVKPEHFAEIVQACDKVLAKAAT